MNDFKYAPAQILNKVEQLDAYKMAESTNKAIRMEDIDTKTFTKSLPDTISYKDTKP